MSQCLQCGLPTAQHGRLGPGSRSQHIRNPDVSIVLATQRDIAGNADLRRHTVTSQAGSPQAGDTNSWQRVGSA